MDAVDISLLSNDEIEWINAFHEDAYNKLCPFLSEEEREFLRVQTLDI
jgi:Xaa-Pro aminopeptidase